MLHYSNAIRKIRLNKLIKRSEILSDKFVNPYCLSSIRFSSGSANGTESKGVFNKLLGLDSNIASKDFRSRWLMAVPAVATHMCIGAPYAWSLAADLVSKEMGFVCSAAADWSLMQAAFPLSIVFVMQGVSASLVGKWQYKVGARAAMATAATAFGGGFMLGAAGIYFHSLPLLYAGYGVLGGTGSG